jgi:manganese-dependent ADP-ribose/CDP-alcohol diphosphatase
MTAALMMLLAGATLATAQPQFSFAVLTDIQYGDQAMVGKRDYRASMGKLREAVSALNGERLEFAIQLGDLIDSKGADLQPILDVYNQLHTRRYSVIGNHDLAAGRETIERLLAPSAHYRFTVSGWRFLVVDGMDVSVRTGEGMRMLEALRKAGSANAQDWNGAMGKEQLEWLRTELDDAGQRHERVIVFCHFPLLAAASTSAHLLWNHAQVVDVLENHPAVVAWFNGHDHAGGYAEQHGIHYVTFPGMVESGKQNSYTVVRVYADRLEVIGSGTAPRRVLAIATR